MRLALVILALFAALAQAQGDRSGQIPAQAPSAETTPEQRAQLIDACCHDPMVACRCDCRSPHLAAISDPRPRPTTEPPTAANCPSTFPQLRLVRSHLLPQPPPAGPPMLRLIRHTPLLL